MNGLCFQFLDLPAKTGDLLIVFFQAKVADMEFILQALDGRLEHVDRARHPAALFASLPASKKPNDSPGRQSPDPNHRRDGKQLRISRYRSVPRAARRLHRPIRTLPDASGATR